MDKLLLQTKMFDNSGMDDYNECFNYKEVFYGGRRCKAWFRYIIRSFLVVGTVQRTKGVKEGNYGR